MQRKRVMLSARKTDELLDAMKRAHSRGIEAGCIASADAWEDAIPRVALKTLAAFGRVNILVNNARATWGAPAEYSTIFT